MVRRFIIIRPGRPPFWFWIAIAAAIFLLASCRSQKEVSERATTDTRKELNNSTQAAIHRDSVVVRDSVIIYQRGDSVRIERWRREYVIKLDSVIIRDTIIREAEHTEEAKEAKIIQQQPGPLYAARYWLLLLLILAAVIMILRTIK